MLVGSNSKARRLIIHALLLCFIAVSLLSGLFLLTHANHEHDHNGVDDTCATCAQLQSIENTLKLFSTVLLVVAVTLAGLFAVAELIGNAFTNPTRFTPVTLKIKLNN